MFMCTAWTVGGHVEGDWYVITNLPLLEGPKFILLVFYEIKLYFICVI